MEGVIKILAKSKAGLIYVTTCPVPGGYPLAPDPVDKGGETKAAGRKLARTVLDVMGRKDEALAPAGITDRDLDPKRSSTAKVQQVEIAEHSFEKMLVQQFG